MTQQINKIGLFGKFNDSSVGDTLREIRALLERHQLQVLLGSTTAPDIDGARIADNDAPLDTQIDLAMVVGGDGTMLSVGRTLAQHSIPTIGVNLGKLGFLADISLAELEPSLRAILQGRYRIEQRGMVRTTVLRGDEPIFSGNSVNDTVISKGDTGRLIKFKVKVNGQLLSDIRSDGVIIATPTGSTAYSLSAGGPLIYPTLPVMSLSLICPHTLTNRPIVLDINAQIEISAIQFAESHANLSLDGILKCQLRGDETVKVTKADESLAIVRLNQHDHFNTLHTKLGWNS